MLRDVFFASIFLVYLEPNFFSLLGGKILQCSPLQENRDVAVVDVPNAFVQTVVSDEDAEHRVTVRIRGPLVDILVSMAPDVYGPYVSVTKTGQKVLIVECLNAVYGTMVAALLYYKKFVKSLKSKAFKLNLYDRCVANKIVKGKQITVCFHVDDCKISHEVPQVIDETIDWVKAEYESIFEDGSGEMKSRDIPRYL